MMAWKCRQFGPLNGTGNWAGGLAGRELTVTANLRPGVPSVAISNEHGLTASVGRDFSGGEIVVTRQSLALGCPLPRSLEFT